MSKVLQHFKDFGTNRFGWLLLITNLLFFAYLFNEINDIQNISQGYCDENGLRHFAFVEPSWFFRLFVLINLPSMLVGQLLSEIIFTSFNDPCINYSYDKYPFIYVGKTVVLLFCQSIQWFLIGVVLNKLIKSIRNF